ncbi:SdpA family antimicrobial peptide system protein [Pseudarthrobacter equi]|nr:SdpA family antimicrobial peptide system protein [Pseudarthrobacter equi]
MFAVSPNSVFHPPGMAGVKEGVSKVIPQGWGFFTKSPRDPFLLVYSGKEEARELLQMPTVKAENYFGLSRYGRAQPVELANIVNTIEPDTWSKCGPTTQGCLEIDSPAVEVRNEKHAPTLCGSLTVVEVVPTPWAYRDLTDARYQADRVLRIEARCI